MAIWLAAWSPTSSGAIANGSTTGTIPGTGPAVICCPVFVDAVNRRGRRRLGYFVLFYAMICLFGAISATREFAPLLDARTIVFSLIVSLAWPTLLLAVGLKLLRAPGPLHERTDGGRDDSR